MGLEKGDDAGVYRISDDVALIQTLDFFTPIVNDAFVFGQIAAANALSDVYAMGGRALCAMNIVCFPVKKMDISVLRDVLEGGLDRINESGATLAGGHSIEDDEIKYGLSVTGIVHPDRVITNRGARAGDALILTKSIGTGIAGTAIKAGDADKEAEEEIIQSMIMLNKAPSEAMLEFDVHACTDVTGFGLLGHAAEMIEGADVGMRIFSSEIPLFSGVLDHFRDGLVPAGLYRNRDFRKHMTDMSDSVSEEAYNIMFDPQTSGGLLIACSKNDAENLVREIRMEGAASAAIIGEVIQSPSGRILIE